MGLNFKTGTINLTHGSGGRAMNDLINGLFLKHLSNKYLAQANDGACLPLAEMQGKGRLVMATDAHVVSPLFFPGGDIGSLAVNGTVNDVAMMGANPLYLSASFILEEGFPLVDLERIVTSMAKAVSLAGVQVVTGDTKVVERGKGDGVFISTTGVGVVEGDYSIAGDQAKVGDAIILSGSIGEHGVAILSQRENMTFDTSVESDCAALNDLVTAMLKIAPSMRCMRDPTRGGLAAALNELAQQSRVGMQVQEKNIPINPEVGGVCELLGLDPLSLANEGKLVAICAANDVEPLLDVMRQHSLAKDAALIGYVVEDSRHLVQMETRLGGQRIVDWLAGDPLPRIC